MSKVLNPCIESWVWGLEPVIPTLGRQQQADPRGVMASQPRSRGELQASEGLCHKEKWVASEEGQLRLSSGLH